MTSAGRDNCLDKHRAAGVGCQECHMKPVRGTATPFSKERERIYVHTFVGANALVPPMLGDTTHAQLAVENLKNSATIELVNPPSHIQKGGYADITVRVTNVGAGHKLPTGFPEGREMWVDFKVTDARGREVYRSGAVKDGRTEPGTQAFKVTMADADGNIVDLDVWKATHVVSDTRLLPQGSADLVYHFPVPKGTKWPLTVTADLNYWSFPQHLIDKLMGEKAPRVPIINMASAKDKLVAATLMARK